MPRGQSLDDTFVVFDIETTGFHSSSDSIIEIGAVKVVEGKIDSWTDYEDGDQIQVTINGVTYLVHSSDVVLIKESN